MQIVINIPDDIYLKLFAKINGIIQRAEQELKKASESIQLQQVPLSKVYAHRITVESKIVLSDRAALYER